MSESSFNYGPRAWHHAFTIIGGTPVVVIFGYAFLNANGTVTFNGKPSEVWGPLLFGIFWVVLLYGVVNSVFRIRHANERRRGALTLTETGLNLSPSASPSASPYGTETVLFRDVTKTKVGINGNDGKELVVTYLAGNLRLERDDFDNQACFEECAGLIAARSGTELERGWLG